MNTFIHIFLEDYEKGVNNRNMTFKLVKHLRIFLLIQFLLNSLKNKGRMSIERLFLIKKNGGTMTEY